MLLLVDARLGVQVAEDEVDLVGRAALVGTEHDGKRGLGAGEHDQQVRSSTAFVPALARTLSENSLALRSPSPSLRSLT